MRAGIGRRFDCLSCVGKPGDLQVDLLDRLSTEQTIPVGTRVSTGITLTGLHLKPSVVSFGDAPDQVSYFPQKSGTIRPAVTERKFYWEYFS